MLYYDDCMSIASKPHPTKNVILDEETLPGVNPSDYPGMSALEAHKEGGNHMPAGSRVRCGQGGFSGMKPGLDGHAKAEFSHTTSFEYPETDIPLSPSSQKD